MPVWRRLTDFFELRPFFSLWTARVVWWVYIFMEVARLSRIKWMTILAPPGAPSWFLASGLSNAFFAVFRVVVLLMTVRLLIEVLLKFVTPRHHPETPRQRSWSEDASAFFDLRPFYTAWWLQVFWWLFILSMLRAVYIYILGNVPWEAQHVPFDHWFQFGVGLLGPLTWLVGVRLLIEAALMSQPRAAADPQ